MGSNGDNIENHILKLVKQDPLLYKGYTEFKSEIKSFINNKNEKAFLIPLKWDNKDYFRLNSISPAYNSLYYFFEIEKILTSKLGVRYIYIKILFLSVLNFVFFHYSVLHWIAQHFQYIGEGKKKRTMISLTFLNY